MANARLLRPRDQPRLAQTGLHQHYRRWNALTVRAIRSTLAANSRQRRLLPGRLKESLSPPRRAFCSICLAWVLGGAAFADPPTPAPYILAVHPYLPAAELAVRFRPIAEFMGRELGREFSVRVGQDYGDHFESIGRDRVDVAFLGPVEYVRVIGAYGQKPLLARFEVNHQTELHGVIVVRRGSPLRTLAELRGKRFAFGDPNSTMANVVPRWVLAQAGVPVSALSGYRSLATHEDVVLAVLSGDDDAGAVKQEVFDRFKDQGLQVLAVLPTTPDHVFVTREDLPAAEVARLRAALLSLKDRPGGAAILEALHPGLSALVPASDADYNPARRMLRDIEGPPQP
jgi:phosphonate transport system substrate-binding protein